MEEVILNMAEATLKRFDFDWQSDEGVVMRPPKLSEDEDLSPPRTGPFSGLIWFTSSGSTGGGRRWWGLSRRALMVSAQAVNDHLGVRATDRWANVLPRYHVGGFGVWARAEQSQTEAFDWSEEKWEPARFCGRLIENRISLTSLVPTQVYDLVRGGWRSPESLRAVVVGGAQLHEKLYRQGLALGWPLLPSFGMTECASQVATAHRGGPELFLLRHMEARVDDDRVLHLKSEALATGLAEQVGSTYEFKSPLVEGWLCTADRAEILGRRLIPGGRRQDQVKVMGELVDLQVLRASLWDVLSEIVDLPGVQLMTREDERQGVSLVLVAEKASEETMRAVEKVVQCWNRTRAGFERVSEMIVVDQLPRSGLGKIDLRVLNHQMLAQESSERLGDRKFF